MHVVDLSHPIKPEMPVYPGDRSPSLEVASAATSDGYVTRLLSIGTHTGTHVDAPAHIDPKGRALDAYPARYFVGSAAVIHLALGSDRSITLDRLVQAKTSVSWADYLLLNTGWHHHWGSPRYYTDYPALTSDSARWLGAQGLRGIGVDTPSVDPPKAAGYPNHRALLGRGALIFENLTNLDGLRCAGLTFAGLPLPLADADGAPVRAVAICRR